MNYFKIKEQFNMFKQFLVNLWLAKIKKEHKPSVITNNRVLCITLIKKLKPKYFELYHPNDGLSVMVTAPCTDISTYTKEILSISNFVLHHQPIPAARIDRLFNRELNTMSLDRFMITSDGFYSIPSKVINDFKEAVLILCNALEESDHADFGIEAHQARVCSKLLLNIYELLTTLISVSAKI